MSKKQDNTQSYKYFSNAFNKAYSDMTNERRKKSLDSEWKGKWKNVSVHGEIEFRERVAQLLAKSKKSTLFSSFAKACSKPGNCFSTYTFYSIL